MLKRLLIGCLPLLGITTSTNAQLIDRVGVTVSGTYSNLVSSDPNSMERNKSVGYGLGFFAESDLSRRFTILTATEFTSRRYTYSSRFEPGSNATHNLYHVTVPVMAKVRGSGFLESFYGMIGPRMDLFLGSNDEMVVTCGDLECGYILDKEVMDSSNRVVPGWSAALGNTFSFMGRYLNLELRYNDDFGTINKDAGSEAVQKQSIDVWLSIPLQ